MHMHLHFSNVLNCTQTQPYSNIHTHIVKLLK